MSKNNLVECLVQSEGGSKYMVRFFDFLPQEARKILRNSKYNLCAACFYSKFMYNDMHVPPEIKAQKIVYFMEKMVEEHYL